MSIWKELTKPSSFSGEYNNPVASPPTVDPIPVDPPAVISPAADEAPRPNRVVARNNKNESTLGSDAVIEGTIESDGDMRIAGRITGDIRLKGNLTLDAGGRVVGGVNAASATIGGEMQGNLQASGLVKLVETGQIVGDLKVKFLTVALGSRMRGNVEFGWDEPMKKTTENRILEDSIMAPPTEISPQAEDQNPDPRHLEER